MYLTKLTVYYKLIYTFVKLTKLILSPTWQFFYNKPQRLLTIMISVLNNDQPSESWSELFLMTGLFE